MTAGNGFTQMGEQVSGLVIVDAQRGFLAEHTVDIPHRIAAFYTAHPRAFGVALRSRFVNDPNTAYYAQVDQGMTGGDDVALAPSIADLGLPVFDAASYSSLSGAALAFLGDAGVTDVAICGVDTDQCVLATAFAALDAGFRTTVLRDLCASAAGIDFHESALRILKRALGADHVVRSSAFAAAMEAQPATR